MSKQGFTLAEVVVVLALVALAAHLSVGTIRGISDRLALRSAREELISLVHRARVQGRLRSRARIVLEEGSDPWLVVEDSPRTARVALEERGISLRIEGRRDQLDLTYGPMGLARVASATLVLVRGEEEAEIVVSSYGRVRR